MDSRRPFGRTGFLVAVLLFSIHRIVLSQNLEFGIQIGYGAFSTNSQFNYSGKYFELGSDIFYTPKNNIYALKSGLSFSRRDDHPGNFNYLKIPVGFDLNAGGKKFKVIFGLGANLSYLVSYGEMYHHYFDTTRNRFQGGIEFNAGIGYKLSDRIRIDLLLQGNFDLTRMHTEHFFSAGGADSKEGIRGIDRFPLFRIKKRIFIA